MPKGAADCPYPRGRMKLAKDLSALSKMRTMPPKGGTKRLGKDAIQMVASYVSTTDEIWRG